MSPLVLSVTIIPAMLRTQLYADPTNVLCMIAILASCQRHAAKTALVDPPAASASPSPSYGELVENLARGLIAAGLQPGEVIAIFLPNSWEFCAAYHAATLAGAIPHAVESNLSRARVRHQLANSGAGCF